MSLSKKIAAALDENTKAYVLPCTVTIEDSPNRLTLHLSSLDTVGLAFSTMEYANTSRTELSSDALKEWADRLTKRVTYLMEPLKVVEVDDKGGEVQVRSQSPTPRADERGYYEMRLFRQVSLRMERFVFDGGARQRRPTDCRLTREVLERLADDIVASAGG
jgi:hypothetical protein